MPPFTNPFRELLGVRVLEESEGEATITIDPVPEDLLQSRGIVHGGVYATLVDIAGGQAMRTLLAEDEYMSTADLNVSYIRPGDTTALVARGRIIKRGGLTGFATIDVLDAEGELLATGRITMAIRKRA